MMKFFRCRRESKGFRPDDEGSALVELALSLPMLCFMLLGATEFARVAYATIEVSNAAHAAALYGASNTTASTDSTGISNAAATDSGNMSGANAVSVTSVNTACTCSDPTYTPSSCSDNVTCTSAGVGMITTVTVTTQSTFSPLIRVPGVRTSYTLVGQSSQVVSNQ